MPIRPLLVAYFPAADPLIPDSMLDYYANVGVDVVELGLKATNPSYDGDVITRTMRRAVGSGHVSDALGTASYLRRLPGKPKGVLFCYPEAAILEADQEWSGIDGVLCLPTDPEKQAIVAAKAQARGTRRVEFVGYDWDLEDSKRARKADEYVMLQYSQGRTGIRDEIDNRLADRLSRLRDEGVEVPIVTGIGISTHDQLRHALDAGADGIVIGSKAVELAEESGEALATYLGGMRGILDGG